MKVICLDNTGAIKELTIGKVYEAFYGNENCYLITCDNGFENVINKNRFKIYYDFDTDGIIEMAVKIYGSSQLDIAQEEAAELIQAISKYKRYGEDRKDQLVEEIADTQIMIEQLKLLTNIKQCDIDKIKHYKLKRLERRMYEDMAAERCLFDE